MSENQEFHVAYTFEHPEEAQRLEEQAQFFAPLTRRLFEDARITAGMKVLDVGCGPGDVSLLLAELVGPHGTVVGVDKNPTMLETAERRVRAAELPNVSFINEDILTVALDHDFDAVVGRFVLIHIPDKVAMLRRMSKYVRPGGIVAFQEPHLSAPFVTLPRARLFEQAWNWVLPAACRAGMERQMGLKIYGLFLEAGLPTPEVCLEQMVGGGPNWGGYNHVAGLARGLLPLIVQFGIATAEEVAIDTLAQRLREEVVNLHGVAMGGGLVRAWTRTKE